MPLGNPNFIELNPQWVAEDRERFRLLREEATPETIGRLAVNEAATAQEETDEETEAISYWQKVDPVLVAGVVRAPEFRTY